MPHWKGITVGLYTWPIVKTTAQSDGTDLFANKMIFLCARFALYVYVFIKYRTSILFAWLSTIILFPLWPRDFAAIQPRPTFSSVHHIIFLYNALVRWIETNPLIISEYTDTNTKIYVSDLRHQRIGGQCNGWGVLFAIYILMMWIWHTNIIVGMCI